MNNKCFMLLVLMFGNIVAAQDVNHATHIARYLNDDVVAVAVVDIGRINVAATSEKLYELVLFHDYEQEIASQLQEEFQTEIKTFAELGVRFVYLIIRPTDLEQLGTSVVIPVAGDAAANKCAEKLKKLLARNRNLEWFSDFTVAHNDSVLVASSEAGLQRLREPAPGNPRDLSVMLQAADSADASLFLFGNDDTRRVVRELLPKLPEPFQSITGPLIADGIEWVALTANFPPQLQMQIEIETQSENTAEAVNRAIANGLEFAGSRPYFKSLVSEQDWKRIATEIAPKNSGKHISVSTGGLVNDAGLLATIIKPKLKAFRKNAGRQQQMLSARQLALALLNYESGHQHFPSNATYNDDGKPLLSWRVLILPYIDEIELYRQFKLHEPWDSEHNIKLVEKMPETFAVREPEYLKLNQSGKTVFQVPHGDGLAFDGRQEMKFREFKDGSSNTILIVTTAPDRAVEWTRPQDWEVDLENPLDGLRADGRTDFTAARADGSVSAFPFTMPIEALRALLTRSGGEVIDYPCP